jgi:galactose oxidase
MANLGNAWHIPTNPEPRGRGAMRDPVGALVPGTAITIISGNQFKGEGNTGNQLETGSSLFFRRASDASWTEVPMKFFREVVNNKYFTATIRPDETKTSNPGDLVRYYLRIAYSDHGTTFLKAAGDASATTNSEADAQSSPFSFTLDSTATRGRWDPVFMLPNVGIHASVLPNGRVLMWGRRDTNNLDDHTCTPFVWDPADPLQPADASNPSARPVAKTTETVPKQLTVNLFCSGHAFLADGRLLVVGGHFEDADGLEQAIIYNPSDNKWTSTTPMQHGRWYPTTTTLADGRVLVLAGSYKKNHGKPEEKSVPNIDNQIWNADTWISIAQFPGVSGDSKGVLDLYPRMHVVAGGNVFMAGPLDRTFLLNPAGGGTWREVATRKAGQRDYCPSVAYDVDKIIFIGGGGGHTVEPTASAEIIDLGKSNPKWESTASMGFPRRQHNAVVLPDGTVLVTGGTRGGGGPDPGRPDDTGFNDLRPGKPVHVAELWDPKAASGNGAWTELAAEEVDRCYHGTAVLLPDARVLSAGGGEYKPFDSKGDPSPNAPEDTHREAQIYSPPYLFNGERPVISKTPDSVKYGEIFVVGTDKPNDIGKVSWIRLPSVTHSFNQSQRINFLEFTTSAGGLKVTAPKRPEDCQPGHYMLFVLNKAGVPSIAKIVKMEAATAFAGVAPLGFAAAEEGVAPVNIYERQVTVLASAKALKGTRVVVGIDGTCPYGIGACWGGAYEALKSLERVRLVNPIPDADESTAEVFLADDGLPALGSWTARFQVQVNGRYVLRGFEVTVRGTVDWNEGKLILAAAGQRPPVELVPVTAGDVIQLDRATGAGKPLGGDEASAYDEVAAVAKSSTPGNRVTVTGPLEQIGAAYRLHVRMFDV